MAHPPATVILIHGLYMNSLCMRPLGRRLRRAGFRVEYFVYPTMRRSLCDSAGALLDFIHARAAGGEVHLVGHSLGGLLLRHLPAVTDRCPARRMVTLAAPHRGSAVVRRLSAGHGRLLFGRSLDAGLLGSLPPWPRDWQLGSLAGTQPAGVGCLLRLVHEPSDGTITVSETVCEGMADHVCVPRSHANMLLCPQVAAQIQCFLGQGRFALQADTLSDIMAG